MSKTVSLSSRVDESLFLEFKQEYLKQLKGSFKEDTPVDLIDSVMDVSNSELVSLAVAFALKYLKEQK